MKYLLTALFAFSLLGGCQVEPCKDYSYVVSRVPGNAKVATCTRWEGMNMRVEDKGSMLNRHKMVHCTCPEKRRDQ